MDIGTVSRVLQVPFPITANDLKVQYRKLALLHHPDRIGGDEELFKQITAAYDFIKSHPDLVQVAGVAKGTHTIEGFLLSELGLGLGPSINGIPHNICKGKGYIVHLDYHKRLCGACNMSGWNEKLGRSCFACNGHGYVYMNRETEQYVYCSGCKGTGEIRIWNPVIPKGAILTSKRRKAR